MKVKIAFELGQIAQRIYAIADEIAEVLRSCDQKDYAVLVRDKISGEIETMEELMLEEDNTTCQLEK